METGILPPELKSIKQLFTGDTVHSVPIYQRSFSWGPDEIEELWEDIVSTVDRKSDYFLGTVVLQKRGVSAQEIIDGQQRLACISMIFSAIRNVFLASNDDRAEQVFLAFLGARDYSKDSEPTPNLVLNRINNEHFVNYVIASKNSHDVTVALREKGIHKSNRLLLKAYKFFLEKVTAEASKLGTKSDKFIVPLIDCLRSNLKFITIPVTSDEDANLFFESLNARGIELAVSDLVKNRLYFESADQVSRAQNLWEQMENELIAKSIPEYLRHFWIAQKADLKNLNVREKHLYRAIANDVGGKKSSTIKLLKALSTSARDYVSISDYNLWPDDDAYDKRFEESLIELKLFRVSQCNPLLLNAIQCFGSPKDIAKTFRIVANFSYRYFIIGNQSPGNLERESAKIAHGIRTGDYPSSKDVADALRSINPDKNFRSDFSLATMPKSRAKIARYTLAKLTNHMSMKAKSTGAEQIANPNAKEVNLEHVLPQSFDATWQSYFSNGVDPADYVFRIGNLTLLTTEINSEAANKSFPEKKEIAFKDSTLAINTSFAKLSKWGDVEIDRRQEGLSKEALEIWRV